MYIHASLHACLLIAARRGGAFYKAKGGLSQVKKLIIQNSIAHLSFVFYEHK